MWKTIGVFLALLLAGCTGSTPDASDDVAPDESAVSTPETRSFDVDGVVIGKDFTLNVCDGSSTGSYSIPIFSIDRQAADRHAEILFTWNDPSPLQEISVAVEGHPDIRTHGRSPLKFLLSEENVSEIKGDIRIRATGAAYDCEGEPAKASLLVETPINVEVAWNL